MSAIRVLGVFSLLLPLAGGAQAAVLFNNLPPLATTTAADPIAGDGPQQFNSFTAGPGDRVDTIELLLDANGESGGSVDVAVYNDSGMNTPGTLHADVGTVLDSELTGVPTVVPFTGLDITGLTPGDRYWVVLTDLLTASPPGPPQSDVQWSYATDASGIGVANEYNGASTAGTFANSDFSPYVMCVSNTSTDVGCALPPPPQAPEPTTLGIIGVGLAALGLVRRRRSA
jgi:hypothetical protein